MNDAQKQLIVAFAMHQLTSRPLSKETQEDLLQHWMAKLADPPQDVPATAPKEVPATLPSGTFATVGCRVCLDDGRWLELKYFDGTYAHWALDGSPDAYHLVDKRFSLERMCDELRIRLTPPKRLYTDAEVKALAVFVWNAAPKGSYVQETGKRIALALSVPN